MRVLLLVDMEGISQITDYRQLWSEFPEHWEAGQAATTADAQAAAKGLKAGGAKSITICELHSPIPEHIIDSDSLPDDIEWAEDEEFLENPRLASEHDALFLLGWHSRCGTPDGFMSHTNGRNVRIAIDGQPVTEVHINAWRSSLPVIGVTGDEALGEQLDCGLEDTPFLSVKKATSRGCATPGYTAEESPPAIEAFARWCAQKARERNRLPVPERFVLTLSMPPELADKVDGISGMRRTSPAIVARSVTDWWFEAEPAVSAAMHASFRPLTDGNASAEAKRRFLQEWAEAVEPEWLT